jgi:NUMOD4 motif/HNH endonuclease
MTELTADSEEWRPVVGWEGFYEVSSAGRVRSIPRASRTRGVVLKPSRSGTNKYPHVDLWADGENETRTVHSLVAEAFVGQRTDGTEVRHLDGDDSNCQRSNLAYGTSSENSYDITRHGRNRNANKTHCDHGHEFTPDNTMPQSGGRGRQCRECRRRIAREWMRRHRAQSAQEGRAA